MAGSHHVNWNKAIYRKGAVNKTETDRLFLAATGFNTNLVQFLPLTMLLLVTCKSTPFRTGTST